MGLGGHVLWTAVIRTLHEASGRPVRVCHAPKITDLLAGRLYCGDLSLADDPVFSGNPRIEFPPTAAKSTSARWVDRAADLALRRLRLGDAYERLVFALAERRRRARGQYDAHLDLHLHSYVSLELPDRLVWKTGGHIVDIMLSTYGLTTRNHRGELQFTREEESAVTRFCASEGIAPEFVLIEPNSKDAWFGDLRVWPIDRWQSVVDRLSSAQRWQVVQIGEAGGHALRGVIDLRGKLSVRLALCLITRARLFLGLEGGLMHVAGAVGVPSVIVWGGLTFPEFAGYPETQRILCAYVECAPCGLRGTCPFEKKCLTAISDREVFRAVEDALA